VGRADIRAEILGKSGDFPPYQLGAWGNAVSSPSGVWANLAHKDKDFSYNGLQELAAKPTIAMKQRQ